MTAQDYSAAAMVYQHGTVPDHYFQALIRSKRAVELGDESRKYLMALGLDRYLMYTGRKQLFGSQARKLDADDLCWCLFPVESTVIEEFRLEFLGKTLDQQREWVKKINGQNACSEVECKVEVKDTPKGSIPGFW